MSEAMADARQPLIAVLDYGIGNLHSAQKALARSGADARLTSDPALIADADGVVLPGVGAFGACMRALDHAGLVDAAQVAAHSGRPFLGICVGMQMLFDASEEDDTAKGLGIIPGTVRWIQQGPQLKLPQMQWNRLELLHPDDPMFELLVDDPADGVWVYFVHSLHGVPDDERVVAATVDYGGTVNAAFRRHNVFAVQFHPEKSSGPGLRLLSNFVDVCARSTTGVGS